MEKRVVRFLNVDELEAVNVMIWLREGARPRVDESQGDSGGETTGGRCGMWDAVAVWDAGCGMWDAVADASLGDSGTGYFEPMAVSGQVTKRC